MATVIRFARHGTKKKPYFRIVVQDHRSPRDGKFIEHIGAFDPVRGDQSVTVSRERLQYWLGTGAKMSESVKNTLKPTMKQWDSGVVPAAPAAKPASKSGSKKEAPKEQ